MSEFRHVAVYGMTGQGKSMLVKSFARRWRSKRKKVMVYTPTMEQDWPDGCLLLRNADELEWALGHPPHYGAAVVIDEAFFLKKQTRQRHELVSTVGNLGRHLGYTVYALTQFPTALDYALRLNCAECFCFALGGIKYAKAVWEDFNHQSIDGEPVWKVIMRLQPFECVHLTKQSAEIVDIHSLKTWAVKGAKKGAKTGADKDLQTATP